MTYSSVLVAHSCSTEALRPSMFLCGVEQAFLLLHPKWRSPMVNSLAWMVATLTRARTGLDSPCTNFEQSCSYVMEQNPTAAGILHQGNSPLSRVWQSSPGCPGSHWCWSLALPETNTMASSCHCWPQLQASLLTVDAPEKGWEGHLQCRMPWICHFWCSLIDQLSTASCPQRSGLLTPNPPSSNWEASFLSWLLLPLSSWKVAVGTFSCRTSSQGRRWPSAGLTGSHSSLWPSFTGLPSGWPQSGRQCQSGICQSLFCYDLLWRRRFDGEMVSWPGSFCPL